MLRVAESREHHLRVMPQLLLLGIAFFQAPAFLAAQDLLYVASQEEVTVSIIDTNLPMRKVGDVCLYILAFASLNKGITTMRNLIGKVVAAFLLICGGALPGAVVLADGAAHKVVIQVRTDDERTQ